MFGSYSSAEEDECLSFLGIARLAALEGCGGIAVAVKVVKWETSEGNILPRIEIEALAIRECLLESLFDWELRLFAMN